MKEVFYNRALKILLLTNAVILMAVAMLGPIYALFVKEIGGDLLDASYAVGALAMAAAITTLVSGKYSDKIKENELIVVAGYAIVGMGFLLYMVVNSMVGLLAIQILIGIGEAIYSPAFDSIYSKHLSKEKSGTQWGIWEAMHYTTMAVGAVMGGIVVNYFGFQTLFGVMGLVCFSAAGYILLLPRKVL